MKKTLIVLCLLISACKTVGVSMTPGGYAEVSPQVANEMILDSRQVVIARRPRRGDVPRPRRLHRGRAERPVRDHRAAVARAPALSEPDRARVRGRRRRRRRRGPLLTVAGFRNVVHISGGLRGWIERGYRTVNAQ